ncbi:hypothetical protein SAMN05660742_10697 [Propionispira arboris]|uniref:Uncharacterized protein n=1 Tax=Propionispira arboris TaxID=84035 RepID=A0A1H6YF67_9FIRM|nr:MULTISPECIES: hypothetical protein [Propionispira]SEJ35822.1 hypothetical protein SAMN05660742_10697 [Propionispira arboris]
MRLSDEILQKTIEKTKGIRQRMSCRHEHNKNVFLALIELKERREADNVADTSNIMSLDIKGQLRLIRDKCPDIYIRICNGPDCAGSVDLEVRKDCNYPTSDCQECWNKALEGEE